MAKKIRLGALCALLCAVAIPALGEQVTELTFDKTAKTLSADDLSQFAHAYRGFTWQKEDETDLRWRPQGITGYSQEDRQFLLVSWYGRNKVRCKTAFAGARISIVEATDWHEPLRYTHVLLTDNQGKPLAGIHAGGIAVKDNSLYLADSRSPHGILVFPMSNT